ncbi:hypothetical protein EB810_15590 [Altererythrobacter sp. FM1]|nr:hypothetical protein EB810_15590 [Altererythrobacter sp. FM1]
MWINIGSYYSSNERDSQLDGDEYVSELIYNLDDAGAVSPVERFNESKFNNEYRYRFDYLVGNNMTVSDSSGVRSINIFDMMKISDRLLKVMPSRLAMKLENSHGTHTIQVNLKDSAVVKVAQDCGWQTGTPVRYKLTSADFPSDRPVADTPLPQVPQPNTANGAPSAEARPSEREASPALREKPVVEERHDLNELMGGVGQ